MNLKHRSGLPGGIMIRKSTHEQDAAAIRHNHLKMVLDIKSTNKDLSCISSNDPSLVKRYRVLR